LQFWNVLWSNTYNKVIKHMNSWPHFYATLRSVMNNLLLERTLPPSKLKMYINTIRNNIWFKVNTTIILKISW
jgi:hypothetical protein